MTQLHPLALALVQRHAAMAAGEGASAEQAARPGDQAHGNEMAAVLQACRMLGFVEPDAQCVASAWRAQSERTGAFDPAVWPVEPVDFGLDPQARGEGFAPCPRQLGLYAVLPDAHWVGRMARAGVPTVQLRFKSADAAAIRREVRAAIQAVEGTPARLFINDYWQVAIEAGAYGVHLGQEDMAEAPIAELRAAGVRLGLSTHGYAEMLKAEAHQPSYMALGAVFPTTLKRMATAPQGLGRLHAYARLMRHRPLVAIGGIDEARMAEVLRSGVGSVAVVRAITGAGDPEAAAGRLGALVQVGLDRRFVAA